MKRPLTFLLGAAFAGALLAPAAMAAEPLDYAKIDLRAIKTVAFVTNAPADPVVPKETRADFDKRFEVMKKNFNSRKQAEAVKQADALLRDFDAHPALLRRARLEAAYHMCRDRKTAAEGLAIADALLAEKGRPSREVSRALQHKRDAERNLKLFPEAVRTTLRLLAQPDLNAGDRYWNIDNVLFNILRYDLRQDRLVIDLAESLVSDATFTEQQRADFADTAAWLAGRFGQNDRKIRLCETGLRFEKAEPRIRWYLTEKLAQGYCDVKPTNRFEEAMAVTRAYYGNKAYPLDFRVSVLAAANDLCKKEKDEGRKTRLLPVIDAFLATNGKDLTPGSRSRLRNAIFSVRKEIDEDAAETLAYAKDCAEDTRCDARFRGQAALFVARPQIDAGCYDEAAAYLEGFLPAITNEPGLIGDFYEKIILTRYVEKDLDGMITLAREAYRYNRTPAMTNEVVELIGTSCKWFRQYRRAAEYYEKNGALALAADLYGSDWIGDREKAKALRVRIVEDKKAGYWDRYNAYRRLLDDPVLSERYFDLLVEELGDRIQGDLAYAFDSRLSAGDVPYYGRSAQAAHDYALYRKALDLAKRPHGFRAAQYASYAFADLGQAEKIEEICKAYLAETAGDRKAAETYQIAMTAEVIRRKGDEKALLQALVEADKRLGAGIAPEERVTAIEHIGSLASLANNEALVRALAAFKDSLYVPQPKKRYVVRYCEEPILGLSDWTRVAKTAPASKMDREFGGTMDFLATDVSTGDRGEGIAAKKADGNVARPELSVACDVNGIHFRFECPDERARDIGRQVIGGGSYEGYIAPGENQPYVCFLYDLQKGKLDFWNTTYDTANHRRINDSEISAYRTQTLYTDKSVVTYMMLSWDCYATLIPADGTVWDFENILWGRKGSFAWNGTKSIHGRSTWGELEFRIPEKGRVEILKRLLFLAKARYGREKWTSQSAEGIIEHWSDSELGDLAFHEARVKPLVAKLDGYADRIKDGMTDAEVLLLADEALPQFSDLRFTIARMRAEWLEDEQAR